MRFSRAVAVLDKTAFAAGSAQANTKADQIIIEYTPIIATRINLEGGDRRCSEFHLGVLRPGNGSFGETPGKH